MGQCLSSIWHIVRRDSSLPTPPPPGQDPFYQVEASALKSLKPGSVIRSRRVEILDFPGLDARTLQAWQVAYSTTSELGEPQITVMTVLLTPNPRKDRVVIYGSKMDSASSSCRTSYALLKENPNTFGALSELVFLEAILDHNWVVVVPDYESQTDAFGAGRQSGQAVLDSIRAIKSFAEIGLDPAFKAAAWGYSGGALACGWAASLQSTYAPDLNQHIVGWCCGGMPVDLGAVAKHVNGGIAAGLTVGVVQGLANAYPDFQRWLDSHVAEEGKDDFEKAKTAYFKSFMMHSLNEDVLGKFFTVADVMEQPEVVKVLNATTMGYKKQETPIAPMLIHQSKNDEVVPVATVDALVEKWGKAGANIQYIKDTLSEHMLLNFTSTPSAMQWIDDRLEGRFNHVESGKPLVREVLTSLMDDEDEAALSTPRRQELNKLYKNEFEGCGFWIPKSYARRNGWKTFPPTSDLKATKSNGQQR